MGLIKDNDLAMEVKVISKYQGVDTTSAFEKCMSNVSATNNSINMCNVSFIHRWVIV